MGQGIANYLSNIINDKNIKGKEREMLIVLKSFDKENNNEVQVTINTLMEYMNTTNRTGLCKMIRNLNDKGYLDIEKGGGRTVNVYRFIKDYLIVEKECCGNKSYMQENVSSRENVPGSSIYGNESYMQENVLSRENVPGSSIYGNKSYMQENIPSRENVPGSSIYGNKSYMQENVPSRENVPGSSIYGNKSYMQENIPGEEIVPSSSCCGNKSYTTRGYNNINNNNINNNNNYINNSIDDVFINILKHWNSQDINNTLDLDLRIRDSITTALRKYTFDTIIDAISNYSEVYYSEYFYNIRWNINNFLTSDKGIGKFTDNGDMWESYSESYYKDDESYDKCGIDIHDYIDV